MSHSNYAWLQTSDDLLDVDGLGFIVIYTALPSCNSNSSDLLSIAKQLWDIVLTRGLAELNKPVVYALAPDDAHTFQPIPDTPG